ncbi:MAG: regulatory protein RecX [Chloroflexi bacterium]|nr:regulatory protein RecX [Chloroflexota bacterium]
MTSGRRKPSLAERRAKRAEVDDPNVVLEAALRFLEARQRSVAEVRRRLTTAGYREELVTGAIDRLGDLGILDDQAFTAAWVESRDRARPRGERALRQELRLKGVASSLIDEAMGERRPEPGGVEDPDLPAAERLLARHRSQLNRVVDPRQRRQRAYALLVRNGFDSEIAGRLAQRVIAAEPADLDIGD